MYRVGICDDEIITCTELEQMIKDANSELGTEISIMIWYSGQALLQYLEQGNNIDILFLDIELPDKDGINIGKVIRDKKNYDMVLIYISSKQNYIMQLFQNQPIAFLVKPISLEKVLDVLKQGYKILECRKFSFAYKKEYDTYYFNCSDIIYFCSDRKKINIFLCNGSQDAFYGKLADIYPKLPGYFSMIHKSYIINRNFVSRYSYDEVQMMNGAIIAVSKANRNQLKLQIQADQMKER